MNPELLERVPRNSIVACVATNAEARRGDNPAIFFPMMSHIDVPIKPGEHVWVMFENPERSTTQGFWLSRIVEPIDVDDLNYTHADRKFDDRNDLTAVEKALSLEVAESKPGFPNGGNTEESFTLRDPLGYQKIEQGSIANRVFTREPVPRFTKRPADLVLKGSNNALICLGEDRVSAASEGQDDSTKKADTDIAEKAGTIDIVVGRGRELPESEGSGKLTAPPVIKNTRSFYETDKVTTTPNASEGNPDFVKDAARIYVTMNSKGDTNFSTKPSDLPKIFGGGQAAQFDEGSFVIAKGDHIRIIARQDDNAKPSAINGSIRIIKEGKADDEGGKGRGAIIIEPDGTVVIDGPHIVIGSDALEKGHGAGEHIRLGQGATEPIVLGNTLKDLLTEYSDGINTAVDGFTTQLTTYLTAINGASFGNFGIPLPALGPPGVPAAPPLMFNVNGAVKFKADVKTATTTFQNKLNTILSKIGKTR